VDRLVAARKLLGDLVKDKQIEIRRLEIVGRDLAQHWEALGRPPGATELEVWLDEHAHVIELYASAKVLDELIERYLTPPREPAKLTDALHPELERQLREDPDNRESYQVYADWLQEHSDPLGELIALGVAATDGGSSDGERFDRFLSQHEARFLGGMARHLAGRAALSWRFGMVREIEDIDIMTTLEPKVWEEVLQLRVCGALQAIRLRHIWSAEHDDAITRTAAESLNAISIRVISGRFPEGLLRRNLRSFTFDAHEPITITPDTFPPSLEHLEMRAGIVEGAGFELGVRDLHLRWNTSVAQFFARMRLPRLERLTLDFAGASAADCVELLEAIQAPALTRVALGNGVLEPATIERLAKLPLASRLTALALNNLQLTDERIRQIAGTSFASLTELDVSYNELSREGIAAARGFASTLISLRQARPGNSAERRVRAFAGSRLQVAEEIADPAAWQRSGIDGTIRWARYRGDAEYELFVTADLEWYGCSCPSRYQPCKHVVALALLAERTPLANAPSEGIEDRVG
jgi:uncharacterized protein (TIGR02996 family)